MNQVFARHLQAILETQSRQKLGNILYVYAGTANPEGLRRIRGIIPRYAPLLYFHPETEQPLPDLPLTLTAAARPEELEAAVDTATLVINCLKYERIRVAAAGPAFPREFITALTARLNTAVRGISQERFSRLINLRCGLINLPRRDAGVAEIVVPPNTPAVICGAGPSLHAQLDALRTLRDRIYLIAVGKLAPVLLRHGIRPDAVVYVDCDGYDQNWREVFAAVPLLVTIITAAPEVAAAAGHVIFAAGPSPFLTRAMAEWGETLPELAYGGTATVTALDFVRRYGFSAAALIGNDYAVGLEQATHLPGYGGDELLRQQTTTVPGNDGPVAATPELLLLKENVETYLAEHPFPVVNATVGGAVIAGTVRMSLEAFTAHPRPADPPELRRAAPIVPPPRPWNRWLDEGAREHAAHLALEEPGEPGQPCGATENQLYREFAADLREVLTAPEKGQGRSCLFPGIRRYAIARIRPANPELADWLQTGGQADSGRFYLQYNSTESACVTIRNDDEVTIISGNGYLTMNEDCEQEIMDFLQEADFSPERDALIAVAPASWHHPIAVARRYPAAAMMAVEPWPELLSLLFDRCQLLHRIPASTVVAAAGTELTQWRRLVQSRIRQWRQEGRRILTFVNPRAAALSDVQEVVAILCRMLPDDAVRA